MAGKSLIQHPTPAHTARRQPHLAEIRRWRRQSVQMGRKICYVRAAAQCGSKEECAHILSGVAKAASRCCELANPAQVRQIASQTEDLLRRMRFVAGRGRCGGEPSGRYCRPGALRRRAIGKMLLAGGAAGGMERSGSLSGRACRSAKDAAMQQMHSSRCDAADAQKQIRWAPERKGEQAPIVGTEKATRHRGL